MPTSSLFRACSRSGWDKVEVDLSVGRAYRSIAIMTDQAQAPAPEAGFKAASEWLSSTPAAAHLPNETKLEVRFVSAQLFDGCSVNS